MKKYSEIMEEHSSLSNERGFAVLSEMHKTIALAFNSIISGDLSVDRSVVESLRACMIVIVALVKQKDLNISEYLYKAEEFGKKYLNKNLRV